jgi:altronate hydrolase
MENFMPESDHSGGDIGPGRMLADHGATFNGIRRPDGRVGTRNYIGVISTVNCAASVVRMIADAFSTRTLSGFQNIDGVVPIRHTMGCACGTGDEGYRLLLKTLAGYATHPNFAGVLLVGLGCEVLQIETLLGDGGLEKSARLQTLTIQDQGGTRKTVDAGIAAITDMLPAANRISRHPVSAGHLILGLQCGGSDAYSGITANPALGIAADLLVGHGGTAVLGETPEIHGAEHLLIQRAASPEVGQKLIDRIRWWQTYTAGHGAKMDNNPSPGNKAGGLTTIIEKSLGAVAKGGSAALTGVIGFADPVTGPGLFFMDTPGYDPVSVTGMVAGGVNLVCFTTGRGSVFGCKPVPVIKLATNSSIYHHMQDDMDVNCGTIVDGESTVIKTGERIFDRMLKVASGEKTNSERLGLGDDEFVPWQIGVVM